ncbi:hypothetical protein LTR99_005830 [Exophiala xenobiotica]|uniref:WSC domain-containing protein n=1 Tax=Vermiconidia calcicola TaxID=1690605 RepID=A0AAV9QEX7_9PEZI|nr:hypothetical protein LTR92_006280 [Exophiala xenobiotica]KAK5541096.1 hypothetical protein LTR25_002873 [Vermiconidia calcicola]KAK5549411.1 hypothetical protein LTR23_000519 [Chaetothyriales sp. CCFEE 6169]KAK5270448.1 hypothetical protein LTR96_004949 [Exophiala xenobiotica]KAK5302873.1 hypothetical protein LTR99_005830 [Exophiala xenobiotica]
MKISTSSSLALSIASWFASADAFWRMNCGIAQVGRIDPILSPNAISGHTHLLSGAINVNTTSNFDSLSAASCTTCSIQKDLSAYWTPLLYYQYKNGSFIDVPNQGTVVYYLGRGEDRENIIPFPYGFKMLSGDSTARSYDNSTMTYGNKTYGSRPVSDRVSFVCIDYNNPQQETPYLNNTNCPNGLRAQIQFQSCWDGVNLYKSDQSHVAYMSQIDNGVCPPTHPKPLPHLFFEIYYFPNEIDSSDGGQFVFSNGDTTGYGFHGDFLNAWDNDVLTEAVAECINGNPSGVIEECAPLNASQDEYFGVNCPERASLVNEQVRGVLPKLPGCNDVTYGPAKAPQGICSTQPSLNDLPNTDGQKKVEPVANTTTVSLESGKTATYQGCYMDGTGARSLSGASTKNSTGMSTATCAAYCQYQGYSVFGTEYSSECYCGNSISAATTDQSDCAMVCSGNMTEYCGGSARLSVWSITGNATETVSASGPSVSGATYISCYSDDGNTRTLSTRTTSSAMTLELCAQTAQKGNYQYFGIEYASECWTGNTLATSAATLAEGKCSMSCSGNATETCGGPNALSLFTNDLYVEPGSPISVAVTGSSGTTTKFNFIGCYTEGTSGRTLGGSSSYSTSSSNMTVEMCASACYAKGYSYAGVEYSKECYCNSIGITNGGAIAADSADCSMLCAGDLTEYCGGSSRLSVYTLKGNATSASTAPQRRHVHGRHFWNVPSF